MRLRSPLEAAVKMSLMVEIEENLRQKQRTQTKDLITVKGRRRKRINVSKRFDLCAFFSLSVLFVNWRLEGIPCNLWKYNTASL